jgi:hypothetical protein
VHSLDNHNVFHKIFAPRQSDSHCCVCVRFSSYGLEVMTDHLDVALRRDLLARWCTLAEQRLSYLTELFETGRWRRYYGERAFLENVREAKKAVETWRALSGGPIANAGKPSTEAELAHTGVIANERPSTLMVDLVALEQALMTAPPPVTDLATMERRYPLLRNAL